MIMTRKEIVTQKLNKTLPLVREYLMILSKLIDTGEITTEREYELVCNRLDDYTDKFKELTDFIMNDESPCLYNIDSNYITEYAYLFLSNRYAFDAKKLPKEEQDILRKISINTKSQFLIEIILDSDVKYSDFLICIMIIVRNQMVS